MPSWQNAQARTFMELQGSFQEPHGFHGDFMDFREMTVHSRTCVFHYTCCSKWRIPSLASSILPDDGCKGKSAATRIFENQEASNSRWVANPTTIFKIPVLANAGVAKWAPRGARQRTAAELGFPRRILRQLAFYKKASCACSEHLF